MFDKMFENTTMKNELIRVPFRLFIFMTGLSGELEKSGCIAQPFPFQLYNISATTCQKIM